MIPQIIINYHHSFKEQNILQHGQAYALNTIYTKRAAITSFHRLLKKNRNIQHHKPPRPIAFRQYAAHTHTHTDQEIIK